MALPPTKKCASSCFLSIVGQMVIVYDFNIKSVCVHIFFRLLSQFAPISTYPLAINLMTTPYMKVKFQVLIQHVCNLYIHNNNNNKWSCDI